MVKKKRESLAVKPYWEQEGFQVYLGDVVETLRRLPEKSVQCCVTSPPYWGLRDYQTATWEGGDSECDHSMAGRIGRNDVARKYPGSVGKGLEKRSGNLWVCSCGAKRIDNQIGMEKTPDEFVAKMVDVFREVRRVLRDDGVLYLNLGDTYSGGSGGSATESTKQQFNKGSMIKPRSGLKSLRSGNLTGIPWRVALALQADGWVLRQDIIWCLSGGAAVYARTQKGDMPILIKDLVRLRPETVKLWNGLQWTQALGWSRSTYTEGSLEIELRSGERIGCTCGHRWPTNRGLLRTDELCAGDVIETTRLPQPDVPTSAAALGVDVAWLCGLYLAEGCMDGNKIRIAGHTDETEARLNRIDRVVKAFHGSTSVCTKGNVATIRIFGSVIAAVIRAYIHGDSAHNKGLKVRVWQRDDEWLLSFFKGYLDGDGCYDVNNDRWRLGFCRNDRLADDFRTLAARLGLSMRLAITTVTGFGRKWPAYQGDIRLTPTTHHNARRDGEIVEIRASRARQFWNIGVADDPHTFALASGVLTHNSKRAPMPESVTNRCTKAHEYIFMLTKQARYFYDADAIREPGKCVWKSTTFGKEGTKMHAEYLSNPKLFATRGFGTKHLDESRCECNKRSVWTMTSDYCADGHFATFPEKLPETCVLATTSEHGCCSKCGAPWERVTQFKIKKVRKKESGKMARSVSVYGNDRLRDGFKEKEYETLGWRPTCHCNADVAPCRVLDPFLGAGTTLAVAARLKRCGVGIDLSEEYLAAAKDRIKKELDTPSWFPRARTRSNPKAVVIQLFDD